MNKLPPQEELETLNVEYRQLDEQIDTHKRDKIKLNTYLSDWQRINQEEQELLNRILSLSEGANAATHAGQALDDRELFANHSRSAMEECIEEFEQTEKKLTTQLTEVEEEIQVQKKAVHDYAKD
ncbi:hypothetical protein [Enterococcus termitis]|uniref:DUF5082 domain-containing protein n=1 Tax=Enterococcus termitis TaxID=332950 RepID=A0A1E5H4Z5_9ENTE|nr:hypothetical protein [Enterococcus termitis]OEG20004.1 hypothetical protein BCR25_14540 [Enterococcus termitis]